MLAAWLAVCFQAECVCVLSVHCNVCACAYVCVHAHPRGSLSRALLPPIPPLLNLLSLREIHTVQTLHKPTYFYIRKRRRATVSSPFSVRTSYNQANYRICIDAAVTSCTRRPPTLPARHPLPLFADVVTVGLEKHGDKFVDSNASVWGVARA